MYTERMEGHAAVGKGKALRVGCDVCGEDLAASSLQSHLETQHGIYQLFVLSWDVVDEACPPVSYWRQTLSRQANSHAPFPVAWGRRARSTG